MQRSPLEEAVLVGWLRRLLLLPLSLPLLWPTLQLQPPARHHQSIQQRKQFPAVTKIWATDDIIIQLKGRYAACDHFKDVPRARRAAPDAKTWAGVQLWLWWLPPTSFSGAGAGAGAGSGSTQSGPPPCWLDTEQKRLPPCHACHACWKSCECTCLDS